MRSFQQRRLVSLFVTLAVMLFLWNYLTGQESRLQRSTFTSGYLLVAGVLFLAGFHLRKQLPFLPLGSASTWMQWHVYASFVVIGLFVMHVGHGLPNGILETMLYVLFTLVCTSGVYGLILTRRIPRQLSKLREEVLYERIPALRHEVARRAQAVMIDLLQRAPTEALSDYYTESLIPFFAGSPGWAYYLRPTSRRRNRLHADLNVLARYESATELAAEQQLRLLIDQRDDLDYHQAQQGKLKAWLFVHIALTYLLVLVAMFHAVLVLAFRGTTP